MTGVQTKMLKTVLSYTTIMLLSYLFACPKASGMHNEIAPMDIPVVFQLIVGTTAAPCELGMCYTTVLKVQAIKDRRTWEQSFIDTVVPCLVPSFCPTSAEDAIPEGFRLPPVIEAEIRSHFGTANANWIVTLHTSITDPIEGNIRTMYGVMRYSPPQ